MNKFQRVTAGEMRKFARATNNAESPSLMPAKFWHIYIKLDFQKKYENAETKNDGKSFIRNVMRAATAAEHVISSSDGIVVEVHGSVVHCILPDEFASNSNVLSKCHSISDALHLIFNDSSKVEGWRMAADWGKTLLVRGRGIHNDDSYVSLGDSANAPAKYLFSQLAKSSEETRALKRFMLAWRSEKKEAWQHEPLGDVINEEFKKSASARYAEIRAQSFDVESVLSKRARASQEVRAQAAPLDSSAQSDGSGDGDTVIYYGWVMRADLDGFTARVHACFDNDGELLRLGEQFQGIMDEAARFAERHDEILVQLPWAGDNFTAAVVFADKKNYEESIESNLIEFSLDFSEALSKITSKAELAGWAQSTAGGGVYGNSEGNVYVGAVSFEGRRFLIAAGQGVGRTTKAFSDMDPGPGQLVVFEDDFDRLLKPYKDRLTDRVKMDSSQSTLFRKGDIDELEKARNEIKRVLVSVSEPAKTLVTVGTSTKVLVSSRDYGEE
jgi:hypothetical protein